MRSVGFPMFHKQKTPPIFRAKKTSPEREQLLCQLSSPRRYRPTHRILGHSDLVVHVLYGEPAAAATRQGTMGKAWGKMMKMAGWISRIPPKYCWAGWSFELQRGRLFLKRSKTLKNIEIRPRRIWIDSTKRQLNVTEWLPVDGCNFETLGEKSVSEVGKNTQKTPWNG